MAYFTFNQNNSGGSFIFNDSVAEYVIIEAKNADEANMRALGVGIYFNGCTDGRDCSCCGDRWYSQWYDKNGTDKPEIYGESDIQKYLDKDSWFSKSVHVYHADGRKETFTASK